MSAGDSREQRSAAAERCVIEYPPQLPISARAAEIAEIWKDHQLIIVVGSTGSGKTTQLPKIALQMGRGRAGRIGCTQPRRIAAMAMARRVALELGCEDTRGVASQVRFADTSTSETFLKFMTDGILLAETAHDRRLQAYDTIIIDEAHKRSLNIDFLLGYLKQLLPKRPDLKVAISSATLNAGAFSHFFDDAPVIEVEGRTFPVEDHFMPPEPDEDLSDHIARAVEFLTGFDPFGDILVFLPGEREIRDAAELLEGRKLRHTEVLQLYARLSQSEQQRIFMPGAKRRIILSTNVAETSLTIPRVTFCVDSGLARVKRYNPRTRIEELQIEMISQAAAQQRRGRCGRTASGICVHLYGETDLENAAPYTDPEIKRSSLAGVILRMADLRLPPIESFEFMEPPSSALIREGRRSLADVGALIDGRITPLGRELARLPLDPHLGKMLASARDHKVLREMIVTVAFLSLADPKERPSDHRQAADDAHRRWNDDRSDFFSVLNLWREMVDTGAFGSNGTLRRYCKANFLNFNRIREWKKLVAELSEETGSHAAAEEKWELPPYDAFHTALLSGIPRHIAVFDREQKLYRGTEGKKFLIFPGSGLAGKRKTPPEWIVALALVETSRVFARQVAAITPILMERAAGHLCSRVYGEPYFDPGSGFVRAKEKLVFGGLLIHAGRPVDYGRCDAARAREIFIRDGLVSGAAVTPVKWVKELYALRDELLTLEVKLRRPESVYDPEAAAEYLAERLPEHVNSTAALRRWLPPRDCQLPPPREFMEQQQFVPVYPERFPDAFDFGGRSYPLSYRFEPGEEDDGATLRVPESELNNLPPYLAEYPVPGWFAEAAERALRKLPKDLRRRFSVTEAAEAFAAILRSDPDYAEEPFSRRLSDYLADECGLCVSPGAFEDADIPEYLQLKIAVADDAGNVRRTIRELPRRSGGGSALSPRLPGVKQFSRRGMRDFPADLVLPRSVPRPGATDKSVYPALAADPDAVAVKLFLREDEAAASHRRGTVALFKYANTQQIKYFRRAFKPEKNMVLSWFNGDYASNWSEDLVDSAVAEAFGVPPEEIRDRSAWDEAEAHARETLGEIFDSRTRMLTELFAKYEDVTELVRKLRRRPGADADAVEDHLDELFAPGFLRRPALWNGDCRRYLRALELRAQRMADQPARDAEKAELLGDYPERIGLLARETPELADKPELYAFWQLYEEAAVNCFAPEVRTAIRGAVNKLDDAWEKLRL
jgi:ATP-dependent helicase HrpA